MAEARITTWISLQAETPPQQGPAPASASNLSWTSNATVQAPGKSGPDGVFEAYAPIVTRLARQRGYPAPKFLHIPIVDFTAPPLAYLTSAVDTVTDHLARGEVVYLHCWGGRGRAGTVGAAVLGALYPEAAPADIFARLAHGYQARGVDRRETPETEAQRALVQAFLEARESPR